ncbi:MAG: polysaccharide deacetylase family protein [Chloroflexi bacterium]|nr:polysaccharide deacetylase family protein [Chloroflexota bacterium]
MQPSTSAHNFFRQLPTPRHLLFLALALSALFLLGFPGDGPLLTAEPGGLAVQIAPPGTALVPQSAPVATESAAERIKRILAEQRANGSGQAETDGSDAYAVALPTVQTTAVTETVAVDIPAPSAPPPARMLVWDGQPRTARVPVLMYHYLSVPPADANAYRIDLSVSPDLFARQLDRMQAEGYTTISLYDLLAHLWEGAPLPEKPVVLTFDDGYRDNYTNAFPLLRQRGMIATIFVVTDFMDEERPDYLTWEMAREMLAAGISIESHGRNHISLKNRDRDYLVWQALGSLETIEFELGVRPRFVSYPAGEFDAEIIAIFQSANYWAGFTTIQGATHSTGDPLRLHRVRVRNTTEPDELSRLLALDW